MFSTASATSLASSSSSLLPSCSLQSSHLDLPQITKTLPATVFRHAASSAVKFPPPVMWRSWLDCHFLNEVSPGSTPPILDLTSFPVMYACNVLCFSFLPQFSPHRWLCYCCIVWYLITRLECKFWDGKDCFTHVPHCWLFPLCAGVFKFDVVLSVFAFVACAFRIIPNKSLPIPMSWSFSPIFSSWSFILSGLTFRSLLRFGLNFWTWCKIRVHLHSIACGYSVLPIPLLKRWSFPHCVVLAPFLKLTWQYTLGFISGLSILFYWSVCLFLCQYHTVFCFVCFGFFWLCHMACGILVPRPGIKPMPPAVEAWSPNHWTAREFPSTILFWFPISFVIGFEIKKNKASNFVLLKIVFCFFNFLAVPQGIWNHSSPTRDRTHTPCIGSAES